MDTRTKAIDPVCGMEVDPATVAGHSEHGGRTYHFCSAGCKARFDAAPQKFVPGVKSAEPRQHPSHERHGEHAHHGGQPAPTQPVVQLTMGAPRHNRSTPDGEG